jgi:DmsE family decaheme c-type cytochrome
MRRLKRSASAIVNCSKHHGEAGHPARTRERGVTGGTGASSHGRALPMLAVLWLVATGCPLATPDTSPDMSEPSVASTADDAPVAEYIGSDMCAVCHRELAESQGKTVHGWALADASRPPAARGCEACHGAGSTHAQAGGGKGVGDLQTFADSESAAARSAVCLTCHAGAPDLHAFRGSTHATSGLSCTSCHSMHEAADAGSQLRAVPPELCYGCHLQTRAEFALTEHHRVDQGVLGCLDCHAAHGSRNRFALRATNNRECLRCHAEVEGPYVFEHAAVLLEGCTSCHAPHGSANRHLLKYQQVAQLCYQCHTVTPAFHEQPSFRDCTSCHVEIHGSNINPFFLQQ